VIKREEFICYKCRYRFHGQPSFQGEFTIQSGGVKNLELCSKCLRETEALWSNESKMIERQVDRKIEYYVRQHGIDRYADAKRNAYEEVRHLLTKESIIFDGNNSTSGYSGDLSKLEQMARKTIHEDFMINCEEQVRLIVQGEHFVVDGLILLKRTKVVVEYDSAYYHSSSRQKQRDEYKDYMLAKYGGYTVVRIPENIINHEKPDFRSRLLDAMCGIKQRKNKASMHVPSNEISNV
jgi:very-short-patch-repair endonuclease